MNLNLKARMIWPDDWKFRLKARLIRLAFYAVTYGTRNVRVMGDEHLQALVAAQQPFLACYWHQQSLMSTWYLLQLHARGIKVGFLVSPSSDGNLVSKALASSQVALIRGSSSKTGAQTLRNIYLAVKKQAISIGLPPDGPRGPVFEFKPGSIHLASMTGAPLLPIAYAVDRYWQTRSWDRFWVPKPLARCVLMIGEPCYVPAKLGEAELAGLQSTMTSRLNRLQQQARAAL